ncbi:glucose-1-phosphate thymidylyltransferase RfbA [Holosporaceae bacterium 'Namur']|nr:glucose-1-phosphate thymidylyltransferase RfbA [Holosporaceae bacterium 'Namur']
MKGIILAGGSGTRLYPITKVISKQLVPVYDKPMICYPLSMLMMLDITDILIISTPQDLPSIELFLGDGSDLGIKLRYAEQSAPNGIPEAFIIGEQFIGNDNVCLILGDNIFSMGHQFSILKEAVNQPLQGAKILAHHVSDPERFGVVEFDDSLKILSLEEKPKNPKSNYAVVGLYFYDNTVVQYSKMLKPSRRGELEITDLNMLYLQKRELSVITLPRGTTWLDAGTPEALLDATLLISMIEKHQGLKLGCLEEVALRKGFISKEAFKALTKQYKDGSIYKKYLLQVLNEK